MMIVPYDPRWPAAFDAEAARLRDALGPLALRIDHHGSTSVPGLAAKPIIDIQISVASLQPLAAYAGPLAAAGYHHVPHPDDAFAPFFHVPAHWPHTYHVHVVQAGGAEERRTLAFRDYLREHPAAAREYEQLKQRLALELDSADPDAREAYARAKTGFVERVTATALVCLHTAGGLAMSPLTMQDAQPLHALWTAPGVRRFIWDGEVIPFERTESIVAINERLFAEQRFGLWGVRQPRDPRLIGFGGFWHFRTPPELELLYGVADEAWGRGIATDIGSAVVEYGFDALRMPLVRASTDAANVASVRVLDKLGFRQTRRAVVAGLDTVFYERPR